MAETEKPTDPVTAESSKTETVEAAEMEHTPSDAVEKPDTVVDAPVEPQTEKQTTGSNPEDAEPVEAEPSAKDDGADKSTEAQNGEPAVAVDSGTAEEKPQQSDASETKPEASGKPATEESDKLEDAHQTAAESGENGKAASATPASKAETDDTPASAVERDLGKSARENYEFAEPLVTKVANLEGLESATERLVAALQKAPEEKSTTRGYGELALLYGRALLGFVIRGATDGDVLGNTGGGGEDGGEEDVKDAEETKEESTEELCWTQLEVARLAFQKGGYESRLCVAIRTIGEFLLACDQASAAGEEFQSAAQLCSGRERAECLYKRYLSLRRVSVEDARKSLEQAITTMEAISGTEAVVAEMKDELRALPGGADVGKGVKRAADVTVTRVTPKRRK